MIHHTLPKTRFFGLHSGGRLSNFNHSDVIGPKSTEFDFDSRSFKAQCMAYATSYVWIIPVLTYLAPFPRYRELLVKFSPWTGVSLVNELIGGESLNSGLRNMASRS